MNLTAFRPAGLLLVVFDLDGTIADDIHRQHHLYTEDGPDWDSYFSECADDAVIWPVSVLITTLAASADWGRVEIWTGRPERVREETVAWLRRAGVKYDALRMREDGDHRTNAEYKGELMELYGRPDLVFEDRLPATRWWRDQGVTCLAIAEHDY